MHFDSSNHAEEAMHEIIAMTQAIALPLNGDFTLVHYRVGTIDVAWLKEHGTHKLVPIDEYGRLATQCHERVECSGCGRSTNCVGELGHDGEHRAK